MPWARIFWFAVAVAVVAAVFMPIHRQSEGGRKLATKVQLGAFESALKTFETDAGYYPEKKDGLRPLFRSPPGETNWRGPYLDGDGVPKDPWNNDYIYDCPGSHNTDSFDLISCGPDGLRRTKDDIANWTNN